MIYYPCLCLYCNLRGFCFDLLVVLSMSYPSAIPLWWFLQPLSISILPLLNYFLHPQALTVTCIAGRIMVAKLYVSRLTLVKYVISIG